MELFYLFQFYLFLSVMQIAKIKKQMETDRNCFGAANIEASILNCNKLLM